MPREGDGTAEVGALRPAVDPGAGYLFREVAGSGPDGSWCCPTCAELGIPMCEVCEGPVLDRLGSLCIWCRVAA